MRKALSTINREVSLAQKKGMKAYFTRADLTEVYRRHNGKCSMCGKELTSNSAKFSLYVPLRNGGKAKTDNLILVCRDCKEGNVSITRPKSRVEGYNSLAEIIVALVEAVKAGKTEDIQIIKSELNAAVTEFVHTLKYLPPKELKTKSAIPIFNEDNTIADLVEKAAKDEDVISNLKETIDTISTTRRYVVLRNNIED